MGGVGWGGVGVGVGVEVHNGIDYVHYNIGYRISIFKMFLIKCKPLLFTFVRFCDALKAKIVDDPGVLIK